MLLIFRLAAILVGLVVSYSVISSVVSCWFWLHSRNATKSAAQSKHQCKQSAGSYPAVDDTPRHRRTKAQSAWFGCCTGREHDDEAHVPQVQGPQARSEAIGMHPKWCGLRIREPSDRLPSCNNFALSNETAPADSWQHMRCEKEEVECCQQLRSLVRNIEGPKDAVTMLRFLRARKQDVSRSANMYSKAMAWRQATTFVRRLELGTANVALHERFDNYWKLLGLMGRDREGDCLLFDCMGRSDLSQCHLIPEAFFIDHEIYTCVRARQALEEQSRFEGCTRMYYTVVVDLHGLGLQHFKMDAFSKYHKCVRIGEDYFPEMVKRVILVRAPWIFSKMWAIAKHFFDEGTRQKFVFLGSHETSEGLSRYIEPCWLPASLGGMRRVGNNDDCSPILPAGGPVPDDLVADIAAAYRADA